MLVNQKCRRVIGKMVKWELRRMNSITAKLSICNLVRRSITKEHLVELLH